MWLAARKATLLAAATVVGACRDHREMARREAAEATAAAEQIASEGTLTSATVEAPASRADADVERARGEIIAAFRLEEADYRTRLQRALDALDEDVKDIARAHQGGEYRDGRLAELRVRRALLKEDLEAVDRATEQDWATLRTKVDRDLGGNANR
jgi:hypothetical protein